MKTKVIGCPKTIDGDLKCKEVPTSFGFDTACKVILFHFKHAFISCETKALNANPHFNLSQFLLDLTTIVTVNIYSLSTLAANIADICRGDWKCYDRC